MICISKTFHRPSEDMDWFAPSPEFKRYRWETFFKTGKIKEMTSIESSDKLTLCILTIFMDEDSATEYDEDPKCMDNLQARTTYNELNKIRSESSVTTNV